MRLEMFAKMGRHGSQSGRMLHPMLLVNYYTTHSGRLA